MTRAPCAATSCASSSAILDLPIPAGPKTVTKWLRPSSTTRSQTPVRTASSRSRPTIGTGAAGRSPMADVARRASHACTGASFPFATTGCAGRYSIEPRVPMYVSSPTSTAPTGDADCRRAAVLTTSPATKVSPRSGLASSATIASPVLTATRSWSPSSSAQSRTANAARTARSASSPYVTGAPKTPMTASPTNFSTFPPWLSSSPRTRS